MLAARRSRFRGILGFRHALRSVYVVSGKKQKRPKALLLLETLL